MIVLLSNQTTSKLVQVAKKVTTKTINVTILIKVAGFGFVAALNVVAITKTVIIGGAIMLTFGIIIWVVILIVTVKDYYDSH